LAVEHVPVHIPEDDVARRRRFVEGAESVADHRRIVTSCGRVRPFSRGAPRTLYEAWSRLYHCASAPGRTGRKRKVTIKVLADLADGSQMRFTGDQYLSKYKSLAVQGYEGKALVHALLTDDWGTPPLRIRILEDGLQVAAIPYR
jgi:hypothetical protein